MKRFINQKFSQFPKNCDDFNFCHYRDGVKIFIRDFRIDEFISLLKKIKDGDFNQITTGEIWCAEDILEGYQQNIDTRAD